MFGWPGCCCGGEPSHPWTCTIMGGASCPTLPDVIDLTWASGGDGQYGKTTTLTYGTYPNPNYNEGGYNAAAGWPDTWISPELQNPTNGHFYRLALYCNFSHGTPVGMQDAPFIWWLERPVLTGGVW